MTAANTWIGLYSRALARARGLEVGVMTCSTSARAMNQRPVAWPPTFEARKAPAAIHLRTVSTETPKCWAHSPIDNQAEFGMRDDLTLRGARA